MTVSRLLLIALLGLIAAQCGFYGPQMPSTMASHFDGHGEPNGWSSRAAFFGLGLILALGRGD